MLSRCSRLPGWMVRRHCRGLCSSSRQYRSRPRISNTSATAPPQGKPQSARCRGCPPVSSRAAPPRGELSPRPARRASRRSAAPPMFQLAPDIVQGGDKAALTLGNTEMWEAARSQEMARTAPLLPPKEGRGRIIHSVPPLAQGPAVPTLSKKEQFSFPQSSQARGPTVCDALPPHSCPRPILRAAKRVRLGDAGPSVPSSFTPLRCTTAGTQIVPLEPLARRLEAWLALPSPSRWLTCTIRLDYAIQFARRPPKFRICDS